MALSSFAIRWIDRVGILLPRRHTDRPPCLGDSLAPASKNTSSFWLPLNRKRVPNPTQTLGPTQSARIRSLTIEACRILARQFGERVQPRLPFDLHSLLPVPVPAEIPFHELTGPKAIAWLQ